MNSELHPDLNGAKPRRWIPDAAILLLLTGFLLWHLSPADLLSDTTTVGGDTPAHNYLASHLKEQLFQHGRILSWADGWWCGFPMFQYYFCLPYLLTALLSVLIPFNVALKCVSVLGAVLLPLSAYLAARIVRFPRPVPILMAMAMLPVLFVNTHTMWGVNLASTLAGMISNSLSFALLLPAIALAWRDAEEGRFRLRTVLLLVLVMASHFFTSVMAALTLAAAPALCALAPGRGAEAGGRPAPRRARSALGVLAAEGLLAALLMSWWLVPLIAKSAYSMDFGENWALTFWRTFPDYTAGVAPFAAAGVVLGFRRGHRAVGLLAWMLVAGLALFFFGFGLSPVFVNVRLWPFVFFAVMALGAVGLGLLIEDRRGMNLILAATAIALLVGIHLADRVPGVPPPGKIRRWAEWNFGGLETKPGGRVFDALVYPLRGTPGRLANDLCEENNTLGSSRIFELAPHLAGKPILEGGLVNSAIGAMGAYYIQGEISQTCAGFPSIVKPTTFNVTNATRHLELFNVKHFIARWTVTRRALRQDPRWRFLRREGEWELYELTTHDGGQVFIPEFWPAVVETPRWKECSLEWLYTPEALEQPFIFCPPGDAASAPAGCPRVSEAEFTNYLAAARNAGTNLPARLGARLPRAGAAIREEGGAEDRIVFTTEAVGAPHIVKRSYYPNWRARGADRVFMVSPTFMLVFPDRKRVELFYGSTWSDTVGRCLTGLGCLLAALAAWRRRSARREACA